MTDGFTLDESLLRINICGMEFCVEICEKTANICSEILEEAKIKLAQLKNKKNDSLDSDTEISQFLKVSIDKLLGQGAVDKVFGTRKQEISDLADLMCFVVSKIKYGFLNSKKIVDLNVVNN